MTQQHALGMGWGMGFLQQAWVQKYLPVISSLGLHVVLFLLVWATYQAVAGVMVNEAPQPVVAQSPLTDDPGATPTGTGQRIDSLSSLLNDKTPFHENLIYVNELLKDAPPPQKGSLTGGDQATAPPTDTLGLLKTGKTGGPKGDPNGKDKGVLFGLQNGQGTIFGIPGRGGPRDGQPATRVVFVCDASGSMQNKLDMLVDQLNQRIGRMAENQAFNIVFFRDGKPMCLSETGLMWANKANKAKAAAFLENVVAHSQTDPIPALKAAFAMRPELMYLLTDGAFNDEREIVDFIAKANAGKAVQIMTIAFLEQGDYENVLKKIAEQNGGEFRLVKPGDLQ